MEKQQQSYTEKSALKNWFRSKLKPTQGQFWAWMDSYWHKGEKLPINTIDGLGEAVDGKAPLMHYHEQYATNDASSLADDNVLSWKQKLGVDDLDYVEIPTENATENSHPYVVVINDEGKSAKQNANDFGKVDTVNEIEPDENKNVNIGLDDVLSKGNTSGKSIKLESSTSTESFTSTYSNGWLSFSRMNNNILVPKYTSSFAAEYFELNQKNQDNSDGLSTTLRPGYLLLRDFSTTTGRTENSIQYTEKTISLSKSKFVNDVDVTNKIDLALDPSFGSINPGDSNANFTAYLQKKSGTLAYLSDLTNVFNLPTNWTHTQQRFSGLVSKHNDATYNRLLGMDANGYVNEVGLPALTNEMSKSTDAQKDAYRLASRKIGEGYSMGQPRVDAVLPPLLLGDNNNITLVGVNLFLNNTSTDAKVETIDSITKVVIETISNISVHQTMPSRLSFNIDRALYEKDKDYYIRVTHYELESIVNTTATFNLPSSYVSEEVKANWYVLTDRTSEEINKTYEFTKDETSFNLRSFLNANAPTESGIINVLSDIEFRNDKEYIVDFTFFASGPGSNANMIFSDFLWFGIIPKEIYPQIPSAIKSTPIISGGRNENYRGNPAIFYIPSAHNGKLTGSQLYNVTLIIGKGVYKIICNNIVYVGQLPITSSGDYKLYTSFIEASSSSNRSLSLNIINFLEK
ncbi:hypothetical protein ACTS9D_11980 [Empedobacter brevis]|uniref:hypothetical protein n=1 Tax=Empedobacter brevis TaxID=247 RepID=UPI0023F17DB9|nr:hypothetical protein [Empedobacter brevis]